MNIKKGRGAQSAPRFLPVKVLRIHNVAFMAQGANEASFTSFIKNPEEKPGILYLSPEPGILQGLFWFNSLYPNIFANRRRFLPHLGGIWGLHYPDH
jgi:hypothetical protein